MVSDFGNTRYCKKCGNEIVREGDCITMYPKKKICQCNKTSEMSANGKNKDYCEVCGKEIGFGYNCGGHCPECVSEKKEMAK